MSEKPTSLGSLLAGACAATVVDALIFPLDSLKTRSQAPGGLSANGGYRHLYRGIASVALCTIPSASVFFYSYEEFKAVARGVGVGGWKGHLVASSAAEMISCALLTPAEMVKQRAQVSSSKQPGGGGGGGGRVPGSREIFGQLVKGRDWRGLGRGYVGLIGRNVPVTAIQFIIYEDFKDRYRDRKQKDASSGDHLTREKVSVSEGGKGGGRKVKEGQVKLSAFESGLCAGASGSIAAGVTTPMDVIKTRLMLQSSSSSSSSSTSSKETAGAKRNVNTWTVGRQIVREDGYRALFRGLGLRMVWTSVGLGLYLGSYEAMKNYIDGP